jgi:hypothetical protein
MLQCVEGEDHQLNHCMLNKKVLITVTGTWVKTHYKNWIECETTWVSKLREKGFEVLYLMSNPYIKSGFKKIDNFFFANCKDNKEELYLKNHYYISAYFINETDYEYRFHTDNDTFIHPERFITLLDDYVNKNPKDYMGCALPYPGFNTYNLIKREITSPKHYASGGSGFLVSRKAQRYMVEDFNAKNYEHLAYCDKITGEILYKNGIKLFHDSRLLFESPYKRAIRDPQKIGCPSIGDKNSFLAVQHYCNGHMVELMNKLDL